MNCLKVLGCHFPEKNLLIPVSKEGPFVRVPCNFSVKFKALIKIHKTLHGAIIVARSGMEKPHQTRVFEI